MKMMASSSIFRRVSTGTRPKLFRDFVSPVLGRSSSQLNLSTAPRSLNQNINKKGNNPKSLNSVGSDHLIRILNSEIKSARDSEFLYSAVDIPEDFPFTVQDFAGWRTVVLERKFQGENIAVLVDIPKSAAENEDDNETQKEPSLPFAIVVSKENGLLLHVKGSFSPGKISVEGLLVNKDGDSNNVAQYAGPNLLKVKPSFQKAIHDYLEARGVTPSTADFVVEYMMSKDASEYLRWLRKLKVLIEQK